MNNILLKKSSPVFSVLIDALSVENAQQEIINWGFSHESRSVVFANVHVLVTAARDTKFGAAIAGADMVLPDGAPVAWMLRKLGHAGQERVSGPDLMWSLFERCANEKLSIYLYGSTPQTLDALINRATTAFPALKIAGFESPPFRLLSKQESAEAVDRINASGASLVFVGLGCPKQEHWMMRRRGAVRAVMLGVGAAFDFHAGTISRAPLWMREHGLEWVHRFASEPRRLWRRYLVTNTLFVILAARQLMRNK